MSMLEVGGLTEAIWTCVENFVEAPNPRHIRRRFHDLNRVVETATPPVT
jgi:hypothetical protein